MKPRRTKLTFLVALALLLGGCAASLSAPDLSLAPQGSTFNRQGDYLIGANDQLAVKVFGQDSLTGSFTVAPSGVLVFPLVGFVQAEGLTALQLTERLQRALKPYVKNPLVNVVVASRESFRVYFSGEIARPGVVALQARTSLLQGIAVSGGLTRFATGRLLVLRQGASGRVQRYAARYEDLLAGRNAVDRFVLERGDIVHAE
jgi:polysaccharide export outer membrane protein